MINSYTLSFGNEELEQSYQNYQSIQQRNSYIALLTCFIVKIVLLIQQGKFCYNNHQKYYGQRSYYDAFKPAHNTFLRSEHCFCHQIGDPVQQNSIYSLSKFNLKYQKYQILGTLVLDISIIYLSNDNLQNQWIYGFVTLFWHLVLFLMTFDFINSSIIFIIIIVQNTLTKEFNHTNQYFLLICVLITSFILKYFIEFSRRNQYLLVLQNQKWGYLIEELLPSWVIVLKFDETQDQLVIEKGNKNFKKEFQIKDDFALRKFIRQLKVYPAQYFSVEEYQQKNFSEEYQINLEQTILKKLKTYDNSISGDKTNQYYAFYNKIDQEQQRIFKVFEFVFDNIHQQSLLFFEEITENKFDVLNDEIKWRDKFYNSLASRIGQSQGAQISILRVLKDQIIKWLHISAKKKNIMSAIINKQITNSYIMHNLLLNTKFMFNKDYSRISFEIETISIDILKQYFTSDLLLNVNLKLFQENNKNKKILRRKQSNIPFNLIKTDKQKLIQIIITLIDFITIMLKLKEPVMMEKIQCEIKNVKKSPTNLSIKLFHSKLQIPETIMNSLNKNWAGSQLNKTKWCSSDHFDFIKDLFKVLQSKIDDYDFSDSNRAGSNKTQPKCLNDLTCSGLPFAQYLLGQLGPFNIFFFKEIKCDSLLDSQNYHYIKFYIYKDLSLMVDQMNSPINNFKKIKVSYENNLEDHSANIIPNMEKESSLARLKVNEINF